MKGSVVPALNGVQITVVAGKDSPAGGLKAGDIAVSTVTGSDGTYVAGPLYDDTSYSPQAASVCLCLHVPSIISCTWYFSFIFQNRNDQLLTIRRI